MVKWKAPLRRASDTGHHVIHDSKCGNYRVTESHIRHYSTRVYAMKRCGLTRTVLISKHRKVAAAKRACEQQDKKLVAA